jgi:hypothetical protein
VPPAEPVSLPAPSASSAPVLTPGTTASSSPLPEAPGAPGPPPAPEPPTTPGAPAPTPATPGPGEVTLFDAAKDLADLDGWVSSRHLTRKALDAASGLVDGCTRSLTTAGTTAELLVCFGGGMDQVGEKDTLVLLAVDAGGIRVAFRQTVHMTDAPDEGPLRRGHEVQASVLLRDGRDLVVREDDGTCRILGQPLSPGYRARAVAMCAGIGRYSWRAGRFVRTGPP